MNDGKKKKDILIFRIRNNKETAPCLQEFFYIYIKKKKKIAEREKNYYSEPDCVRSCFHVAFFQRSSE